MSDQKNSPITATVNYEKDGVQHGFLKLPYSHDASAWGSIMIPISVVKNGDGPTALLTGANHGDEYEGPVSLQKLALSLNLAEIKGRVIIIPALNYPAFLAGTRTSPIDKGNMNRVFPGKADGTVTEKIADYISRTLLPVSDYILDIHAGGKTLDFVPFAATHILENKTQEADCIAAMDAFNAPYSMTMLEIDAVGMYDTEAEAMGKVFVSTELGGGGSSTKSSIDIADKGVRNFLIHAGILSDDLVISKTMQLDMPTGDCFIASESSGLFEICVDLGGDVAKGQVIARVYDAERTGAEPTIYHATMDGMLVARHFPGLIKMGDCVAVIAVEVKR